MGYLGLVDTDEEVQQEATPVRNVERPAREIARPSRDRAGVTVVGSTVAVAPVAAEPVVEETKNSETSSIPFVTEVSSETTESGVTATTDTSSHAELPDWLA